MADINATVASAASGIVGVIKALIVLFVFVNISIPRDLIPLAEL